MAIASNLVTNNITIAGCLSIYYQNVRGLRTKTNDIFLTSQALPYDIFALTETNLTSDFNNNELFPSNFNVFRRDVSSLDNNGFGRGILIALNNQFDGTLFNIPNTDQCELICVKINISSRCLYIMCCYVRPNEPFDTYQLICDAVDTVVEHINPSDDIIVLGDFNLPRLQWIESDDELHLITENAISSKEVLLVDHFSDSGLFQMSNVKNNLGRQLDLVFSTDADNCVVTASNHLLSTLDHYHPPLLLRLSYENDHTTADFEKSYSFNFRKANFDELNELLGAINFDFIFNFYTDIESVLEMFYAVIFNCFVQTVPYSPQKNITSSPPWYNNEVRSLRNRRNKFWKKYLNSGLDSDYASFLSAYSTFTELSESLYLEYINKMQFDLISNPKRFYQFINIKRKSDGYPSTLKYLDQSSGDPKIITNLFVNFFSLSFSDIDTTPDTHYFSYLKSYAQTSLVSVDITLESVISKIRNLKDDYSPGPDGFPAIVLKKCEVNLAQPLTSLFQLSISNHIFPKLWKNSYIIPIHKKGCKSEVSNYRPIAKLSCIPKLFESIVYDIMYFHCKSLFSPVQHGFLKSRSTTTNLTTFVSSTLCALENGNEVDVVTTDFSKAFDKISHKVIILKLQYLGFPSGFVTWLESYLKTRQYKVLFRSSISNPIIATSGVPQGSHLGPLIFILSINDVEHFINNSNLLVFADDMKISRIISSPDDSTLLQDDLNRYFTWCLKNFLELNVSKCQTITFSRKVFQIPSREYYINDQPLNRASYIRDLGVLCDRELNFRLHIDNIISRANSALGFVKRWSKEFSNPYVTKSLYMSFVRPLLEYASQVWSPHHTIHIHRIEAIQRRFIRFALRGLGWSDIYNLPPYEDRLRLINLQPLYVRREIADVIFIHQLITGVIDCNSLLEKITFNINSRNLRSIPFLNIHQHRTNYGLNEPMTRMMRAVNNRPECVDFHLNKLALKKCLSVATT